MEKGVWNLIGECGVDSGQLMIMDPCYLDSEFEQKDFIDYRAYRDKSTGKAYVFGAGEFENYESKISDYEGKTPNELIKSGVWLKDNEINPNKKKPGQKESYSTVCNGTIENSTYQMTYRMGHAGLGVAFSSGYGDGVYPVYARYSEDGRVAEVKIVMIPEEDESTDTF